LRYSFKSKVPRRRNISETDEFVLFLSHWSANGKTIRIVLIIFKWLMQSGSKTIEVYIVIGVFLT